MDIFCFKMDLQTIKKNAKKKIVESMNMSTRELGIVKIYYKVFLFYHSQ